MNESDLRRSSAIRTTRTKRRTALIAGGAVLTVVGVGACSSSSSSGTPSASGSSAASTAAPVSASSSSPTGATAPTASYSWSSISPAQTQTELDNVGLGHANYSIYKGKTVGVAELAPIEPVQEEEHDLDKCVKANGGKIADIDVGGDPTKSTAAIQTFVQNKDAAIFNDSLDPSLISPEIVQANKAHIPLITSWSGTTPETLGINGLEFQSAARLAQYVIDRLNGTGQVAMVESTATASLRARDAAFVAILKNYPGIKIVATVQADVNSPTESGDTVTKAMLQAHPGVNAIWTDFDGIGEGAAQAVKSAGSKAFVVGFNGDSAALALLRDPSSPFAATMANDLEVTGDVACAEIANMLNGQAPPSQNIYMDSPLVTKDNVSSSGYVHGTGPFVLYAGPANTRWPNNS
jgi:ABC-type sugar transport system substrate-binding protein